MKLNKLYKLQEELDKTILENEVKRTGKEIDKDLLLDQTILALLVEIGELANATRCFKHWSTKGPESKERILDELADVWHFYLSIGNQLDYKLPKKFFLPDEEYNYVIGIGTKVSLIEIIFIKLYEGVSLLGTSMNKEEDTVFYDGIGMSINILGRFLGFTEEEIEQAYMKKHKENYRRQEEGY
jgi:dimeric dUTPase (all-alpha-NTP-PPase superfamily)|nr:MAG TPA: dUTPase [Caudoviricetes sp.]